MYWLIWAVLIYLLHSVERLQRREYSKDNENKIYQVDIFVSPKIDNIGKDIVAETKNKHYVRYKSVRGVKKYDCWDMGNCGWFHDKYGFDYNDEYVTQLRYNHDKKIDMPIRITQLSNFRGSVFYMVDNIEKEPWFNGKSSLSFNYCQFELRNEDNMITFLPLYLNCGTQLELEITENGVWNGYEKHLCLFPLKSIVRDMIQYFQKGKTDKDEKQYEFWQHAKQELDEGDFEYISQNSFDSGLGYKTAVFSHKYVDIRIDIRDPSLHPAWSIENN